MLNIYNTPEEKEISLLVSDSINKHGYEIIRIRERKGNKGSNYQFMIEKKDKANVGILDCQEATKIILKAISESSLKLEHHTIEVSSPGINRPLTRFKDFVNHKDRLIKVRTLFKVLGRKIFRGYLDGISKDYILIRLLDSNQVSKVRFDSISETCLEYESNNI